MIEKEEGGRNNLIKLNIDELEGPEHQSVTEKSIENKDKSEISLLQEVFKLSSGGRK